MICKACKKESQYTICTECKKYLTDVVAQSFECKQCHNTFVLDGLELFKLKEKYKDSFKDPCNCKECKNKRRFLI